MPFPVNQPHDVRPPVRWRSTGTGPPVVLLHGLGGDSGFWEAETAALSAEFRVLTVDLRGSGETPATPEGHTIDDLADDVAEVLAQTGAERAHVVGFSMGGLVAQALAVRHPARVDRLVLASTYAVMNAQARLFLDAVRDEVLAGGSMRPVYPLVVPWLFSIPYLADEANAAWLQAPPDDDEPPEGWLAQYAAQRAFDGRAALRTIAAPTLVLAGEQDRLVAPEDVEDLARGIPGARLTVIPRSGHLINVEQPERFVAAVREHLLGDQSAG